MLFPFVKKNCLTPFADGYNFLICGTLFNRYRPQILEMETKLKPFLPEFIPAVGDPDAFLKIDRPDGNAELLGLTVIDEPSVCRVFDFSFLID